MSSDQELTIEEYETQLKGEMPPQCYELFKKFTACKDKFDNDLIAEKGQEHFNKQWEEPLFRTKGCKGIWDSYTKCQDDFFWKYVDLKNYVARIEGTRKPYSKKELKEHFEKNKSNNNIGFNKF